MVTAGSSRSTPTFTSTASVAASALRSSPPADRVPGWSTERRARMTVLRCQMPAQNGTSGALAYGKQARRRADWATPRAERSGTPSGLLVGSWHADHPRSHQWVLGGDPPRSVVQLLPGLTP